MYDIGNKMIMQYTMDNLNKQISHYVVKYCTGSSFNQITAMVKMSVFHNIF